MKPQSSPTNGTPPNLAGTRAGPNGRYLLLHEIARGGMGAVYRAEDEQFGRPLAVKVLLADPRQRPDLVQRFLLEARITGQLQHPGIPPVYEAGTLPDGRPFLAMKLIEGNTLAELFAARPTPGQDQARLLVVFEQMCQTIAYAHSRGVIHRDLKPGNVMVGAFGEVQVMDWGLAWQRLLSGSIPDTPTAHQAEITLGSPLTAGEAAAVLGTPAYMAPERARGDPGDERADVFGLGAILCELLTGLSPYAASSTAPLVRLLAGDTNEAMKRLAEAGVASDLAGLVCRCLSIDPQYRPGSAAEVAMALTAHLEGARERLRHAEVERARAELRAAEEGKWRWLAVLTAVLVVLVVIGAALFVLWYQWEESRRLAEEDHSAEMGRQAGQDALSRAEELAKRRRWRKALEALAPALGCPAADVAERASELRGALRLALQLREARLEERLLVGPEGHVTHENLGGPVLARHGLDLDKQGAKELAGRLNNSPALPEAISYLYHRVRFPETPEEAARAEALLLLADPSPWRRSVLRAHQGTSLKALEALAGRLPDDWHPPGAIALLARAISRNGGDGLAFRRRAQQAAPDEFWLSFDLALFLGKQVESLPEAVGLMRAALARRPDCAACWNNLGFLLYRSGNLAAAREALERAVKLAPRQRPARVNLALVLYRLGKFTEAGRSVQAALDVEPDDPDALVVQGFVSLRDNLTSAEKCAHEALRVRKDSPEAWALLAVVRLLEDKREAAEEAAKRALTAGPDSGPALFARALLLAEKGDFPEALRFATRGTAPPCFEADIAALLAFDLVGKGRYPEASNLVGLALALQPDHAPAREQVRLVMQLPEGREALCSALGRASARQPGRPTLWGLYGRALLGSGRTSEAQEARRHLARLRPEGAPALVELGLALQMAGDANEARDVLLRAHREAPSDARPLFALAGLYLDTRQYSLAEEAYASAARCGLDAAAALAGQGRAMAKQMKTDEALRVVAEALKKRPGDADLLGLQADILLQAGKQKEALASLAAGVKAAPKSLGPLMRLVDALIEMGKAAEASPHLLEAEKLAPASPLPPHRFGLLCMSARSYEEAAVHFEKAAKRAPQELSYRLAWADAIVKQGNAQVARGRLVEAIAFYEQALSRVPKSHPRWADVEEQRDMARLLESIKPAWGKAMDWLRKTGRDMVSRPAPR
jgi:serine/threonine-protein kinase